MSPRQTDLCACGNLKQTRAKRCAPCYHAGRAKLPGGNCSDCGTALSLKSRTERRPRTGFCAPCILRRNNADPAFAASRAAAIRRKFEEPEHLAKMQRIARRNGQIAATNPEHRARLAAMGRESIARFSPEARAKLAAQRGEIGRKIHEMKMAWCPPEYRAAYKRLTISKRIHASEARWMILQQIADDKAEARRRLLEMSPFERQMEAIRNGAGLIETPAMPSKSYAYTLGGVSAL